MISLFIVLSKGKGVGSKSYDRMYFYDLWGGWVGAKWSPGEPSHKQTDRQKAMHI